MRAACGCVVGIVAACAAQPHYSLHEPGQRERPLPAVRARVVSLAVAARSGFHERPLVVRFDRDADDDALVAAFLRRADARGARFVADLTLVEHQVVDGRALECRRAIVPELVTEEIQRRATTRHVSNRKPVSRMVTQREYQCRTSTQFLAGPVTTTTCDWEDVTQVVTELEWVEETQHVPARTDRFSRRRLNVREPVCTPLGRDAAPAPPRLEARIFVPVTASGAVLQRIREHAAIGLNDA
jgi:hypothetical protein